MALRLAREEGLFAGTSTGANVIAALRLAEAAGTGRDRRHRDVRYRDEVSEQVMAASLLGIACRSGGEGGASIAPCPRRRLPTVRSI